MYSDYLKNLSGTGQSIQNFKNEQMDKVGNLFDQQSEGIQKQIGNLTSDIAGFDLDNVVSKSVDTVTTVLGQSLESASLFMNLRKKLKGEPVEEGEDDDPLVNLLSGFKSKLSSITGDGTKTLSDLTSGAMDKAGTLAKNALNKVSGQVDNITDQVSSQLDNAVKSASNIADQVSSQVDNAVKTASDMAGEASSQIDNAVKTASGMAGEAENQLGTLSNLTNITGKAGNIGDTLQSLSEPESIISGVKNTVSNYLNNPTVTSTDLQPKTINIPNTELGSGKIQTTEPSGTGEGQIELKTISQSGGLEEETQDLTSSIGTEESSLSNAKSLLNTFTKGMNGLNDVSDIAGGVAEGAEDIGIAGLETAGLSLESIPLIGNVIGSIMAIGGTIWSAVSGADQGNKTDIANQQIGQDEAEQAQDKINELKSQMNIDNDQFTGSNVLSSMNSKLNQMGTNIF